MIDELPEDVREEMLELIETEGIRAAVGAMIAVCQDPKAPAAARATAAGHIFRVSRLGGFGQSDEGAKQKELFEMSPAELNAEFARAVRDLQSRRPHPQEAPLKNLNEMTSEEIAEELERAKAQLRKMPELLD